MDCIAFKERLEQIRTVVETDHTLEIYRCDEPATEAEVDATGLDVPEAIRTFLLTCSRHASIAYRLDEPLAPPFEEIFSGKFSLKLGAMPKLHAYMTDWLESNRPLFDTAAFFPVMSVPNGDLIVYERSTGQVHYLSHEDEDEDLVLGESFDAFLAFCASIGFIGNEEWQYAPFVKDKLAAESIAHLLFDQ